MSKPEVAPARLHGFLAKDAPVGVIVRRGPSDWYEIISWHTNVDQFDLGQWFHGTIYPQVCDLSPDGTLFLYFAAKHHFQKEDHPNNMNKWTAISRPPYLTALALWPINDHYDMGGGAFVNNNTVLLHADATRSPEKGSLPSKFRVLTRSEAEAKRAVKKINEASGWKEIQKGVWTKLQYNPPYIFRKSFGNALYHLLRYEISMYGHSTFALSNIATGEITRLTNTAWADFDHQGRIVYGQNGKLFAIPTGGTIEDVSQIEDFNEDKVEFISAPEWATSWSGVGP